MAYANSVTFFGWSDNEALKTINHVLKTKHKKIDKKYFFSLVFKLLNNIINNKDIKFKLDKFDELFRK